MGQADLDLARRAAYRRILAVLKATKCPFVVAGTHAASMHLGCPPEGPLDVLVGEADAGSALDALAASGFKVEEAPSGASARVGTGTGELTVTVAWRLPEPLGGPVDEAWFRHATRRPLVDLRVRIAPPEELLWLLLATSEPQLGAGLVGRLLMRRGPTLDWERLLARLVGLEALLLAHVFLLIHLHPDLAHQVVPRGVIETLLARTRSLAGISFDLPGDAGEDRIDH